MDVNSAKSLLESGIGDLGISLSAVQVDALMEYLGLFKKWNKTYNLSAIKDEHQMVVLHLLDSLSVVPHVTANNWLDVGTGGGLPGIPMAICFPNSRFTLLDSAGKKTRFLHQVIQHLGLGNVRIQNTRAESLKVAEPFDGIISRAFASLKDMIHCTEHLLQHNGQFWAMKGQISTSELSDIDTAYIVSNTIDLNVPGLDASRCLISIVKKPIL